MTSLAEQARLSRRTTSIMDSVAVFPLTVVVLLTSISVFNPIQPVGFERATSNVGPLLLLRLALAGGVTAIGIWGWINSRKVRQVLSAAPGLLFLLLAFVFLATSVVAFAETALISRAAAMINLSYLLFIVTALCLIDLRTVLSAILVGKALFLLITWGVFLLFPSVGWHYEFTDTYTSVARLGSTGHPNGIAREAVGAALLCLAMLRVGSLQETRPLIRFLLYAFLGLSVITVGMAMSRTAMIAGVAAVLAMMFDRFWTRRGMVVLVAGVAAILGGFLLLGLANSGQSVADTAVSLSTKSGHLNELTTMTGRTGIWVEAWGFICERPITGWGLDSESSVMSTISVGTHNLLLYATFSGGIFAGLLVLMLLVLTLRQSIASREPLFRGVATFVLLSGLVETTVLDSFPCSLMVLWIVILVAPTVAAHESLREKNRVLRPPPSSSFRYSGG